ncbi:pogo transposable element, putative [Talaromyces stipitatus ATCC 10500]|uniref:Pogo transposable element, putative n=1 Tax=Talaromyces stipitatus (strain ATCC 10500 / CBS 375.48 / QM 6759 / NRRL 1006) TaxID=441959 RepID=B8MIQ6_TALSN|nr:pogo transposable element, putative [Talaromyces stipitatus ATCC 10500]EED15568.1 pogo transposable element, putative [Talaromyces stipitatus ATCC 10500]
MDKYELALEPLHSLKPEEKRNVALIARTYGVDPSNLRKHFRKVTGPKEAQYNNQRLLNEGQSQALIRWIKHLTEKGLPLRIRCWQILQEIYVVISRYSTGLDMDRKNADKAWKYALYFELLGRKIEQYNLAPEQIYNMDEKGFMLGIMTKEKRIFSRRKYKKGGHKQFLQDGNREWITTIACICANGRAISPSLIYMAKSGNIQDSWLQDFNPKEQRCFFAVSESGWTNNEIGYQWLVDVFDKETKSQASRGWRFLILDGHGSHVNMRFIEYCDRNRILLAIFPAHATHTLQPLDVALFSPLSKAYSEELKQFLNDCQGLTRLTKRLYPFNPEYVIQRFTKSPQSRPSSSGSTASIIQPEDWRHLSRIVKEAVNDVYDKKSKKLSNEVHRIQAENALLKAQVEGLQRTVVNLKKRQNKKKPLLLDLHSEKEGGAIFFSPSKVQQARDLQLQKDKNTAQGQARKDDKKLQQKLAAQKLERIEKAQIRQKKREQRQQEAAEKERQKEEQKLAKLADLQLQNDVLTTTKPLRIKGTQIRSNPSRKAVMRPKKRLLRRLLLQIVGGGRFGFLYAIAR